MNSNDFKGRPGLGILDIEIDSAAGTVRTDPNGVAIMAAMDAMNDLLALPGAVSAISGEPAVVYATNQVTLPLTPAELQRLALRSLRPAEFKALVTAAGMFHEIHDDFYDADSGEALQPREVAAEHMRQSGQSGRPG